MVSFVSWIGGSLLHRLTAGEITAMQPIVGGVE
jgi:hypothetical protein